MSYWRNINPTGAIGDFVTVFRQAGSNRWWFALIAAATTFAIFSTIWHEGGKGPPRPPNVIYITTFAPGRTDAEIIASNIANQKHKEQLAAEQARRDEEVRKIYEKLGRASGMDVDAIERQAAAQQAAEARRQKAQDEALERAGASPQPAVAGH